MAQELSRDEIAAVGLSLLLEERESSGLFGKIVPVVTRISDDPIVEDGPLGRQFAAAERLYAPILPETE